MSCLYMPAGASSAQYDAYMGYDQPQPDEDEEMREWICDECGRDCCGTCTLEPAPHFFMEAE